jgi:hypothetical protein
LSKPPYAIDVILTGGSDPSCRLEAVGNKELPKALQVSSKKERILRDGDWTRPSKAQNRWVKDMGDFGLATEPGVIASEIVTIFAEVFGVPDADSISMETLVETMPP